MVFSATLEDLSEGEEEEDAEQSEQVLTMDGAEFSGSQASASAAASSEGQQQQQSDSDEEGFLSKPHSDSAAVRSALSF